MEFNKIPDKIPSLETEGLKQSRYSIYDYDAYTLQELICLFYEHINQCIHISNFSLEFTKWLMDTGVEQEVKKKIEEMEKDGTLASIINDVLFEELNAKIDEKTGLVKIDNMPSVNKKGIYSLVKNSEVESGGDDVLIVDDKGVKTYPKTKAQNVYMSDKRDLNTLITSIDNKIKTYNEKMETKFVKAINTNDSVIGTFDFANFAGQGKPNATIGGAIHHYTDGIGVQIDNVGENNTIMVLKNANNPSRRPDKAPDFIGNGSFISCVEHNPTPSQPSKRLFLVNKKGDLYWLDREEPVSLVTSKISNSNASFEINSTNKNVQLLRLRNGGRTDLLIGNNGTCDLITGDGADGLKLETAKGGIELKPVNEEVTIRGNLKSYGLNKVRQQVQTIDVVDSSNVFINTKAGEMIFDSVSNAPKWRNLENNEWVEYDGANRQGKKILVEKAGLVHTGGFKYSAFCSGARLRDKEYYVVRCGANHVSNPSKKSVIVLYEKINNRFIGKVLDLRGHVGDFRDPHLSVNSSGNRLMLTCACKDDVQDLHRSYLWTIEENGQISNATLIGEGIFVWGNCVNHPETGQVVTTAYDSTKLYVMTSTGRETQPGAWTKTEIATSGAGFRPTEACVGYWGQKLVCIYRNDQGISRMRTTNAYTGMSGWEEEKILNNVGRGEAPVIPQYTPAKKPLLLLTSLRKSNNERTVVAQMMVNFEGSCTSPYDFAKIQDGGYCSMVITQKGVGVMYYEETKKYEETNLWYMELDSTTDFGNYMYWDFELGRK